MELANLIEDWIKDNNLNGWELDWYYPAPALRFSLKGLGPYGHWSGSLICVIGGDRVYIDENLWKISPFKRSERILLASDPQFFNKLEIVLTCAPVV